MADAYLALCGERHVPNELWRSVVRRIVLAVMAGLVEENVVRPSREQLEACERLVMALAALNKAVQAADRVGLHVEFSRLGNTFDVKCEVRTVVKDFVAKL